MSDLSIAENRNKGLEWMEGEAQHRRNIESELAKRSRKVGGKTNFSGKLQPSPLWRTESTGIKREMKIITAMKKLTVV
jgi:hypothetical protein